ncbi:MAG: hypothetical protein H6713_06660 [Myxococcales bacterium]|nr:hypothetical protein [Myxococcales bacterium]
MLSSVNHRKTMLLTALAVFLVQFNLGYVFHDLAFGPWFHDQIPFGRERYVIPYIAAAFAVYALILAHLFPAYHAYHRERSALGNGLRFGLLMGVVFDALQGGIIEVATFEGMTLRVFALDSGYHVLVEGALGGLVCAAVARASVASSEPRAGELAGARASAS